MNRAHLYSVAAVLAAFGLAVAGYKVSAFDFPLTPGTVTTSWQIEVQARFTANGGPAKLILQAPSLSDRFGLIDQALVAPGYGITSSPAGDNQRIIYAVRKASGPQALYMRFLFDRSPRARDTSRDPSPEPLEPSGRQGVELAAAQSLARAALAQSSDAISLGSIVYKRLLEEPRGDEARLLLGSDASPSAVARLAAEIVRLARTPAREVHGISVQQERRNARFIHWIEVYDGTRWVAVHPPGTNPDALRYFVPWWRGPSAFASIEGGRGLKTEITISRSYHRAIRAALQRERAFDKKLVEFSLFGLPLQAQDLFRTVLVIPAGVLLLAFLRNVVGFKSFGVFMPVLIALAFRDTGLVWGVTFFAVVVALGLLVRLYLERLKLLLVPRLATVVIFVILILAGVTVISHRLGFDRGLSIGLFPIVILTMTIERMTVIWEERGPGEALRQTSGSVIVGALCYFVMRWPLIEHLFFVFPELLLVVLALTLLIGRYSGYRLLELVRFRVLAR
jgi:7 transmembrane helices usually fused to an inactive transglutaminase/Inactive transglutaminase fused to 7 transmembrane helices